MTLTPVGTLELDIEFIGSTETLGRPVAQFGQLKQLQVIRGLIDLAPIVSVLQVQDKDLPGQQWIRPLRLVLGIHSGRAAGEQMGSNDHNRYDEGRAGGGGGGGGGGRPGCSG